MKILLVEDESPKAGHIKNCLEELRPRCEVRWVRSVRTAIEKLEEGGWQLLILDMSLPTFDIVKGESGGRPQGFGGIELMREMELSEVEVPVIVITGYEAFTKSGGEIGLGAIARELSDEFPEFFKGILHFNSAYGDWKLKLEELLNRLGC